MSSSNASDLHNLHIFFLPLLAPGHMIPMLDLSLLLASRGIRSTIITTPNNAQLILHPSLSHSTPPNLHLLTIPFPNLPDNLTALPTPDITPQFYSSLSLLQPHLDHLIAAHRPDCLISDLLYPWSASLAKTHNIPRIAFHGTSYFSFTLMGLLSKLPLHTSFDDNAPFLVPHIPHQIKMTRSQLSSLVTSPPDHISGIAESFTETLGMVMNTFYELEPAYADSFNSAWMQRSWNVGPLFLRNCSADFIRNRGGAAAATAEGVFDWLDGKKESSVLYVCFGSLPRFTAAQLREIREGLELAGRPFVWVVREGLEDPIEGNLGFVIRGWAPQLGILRHGAVGGFVTHCGWNSCIEGIAAGVPMVTWPLFADQQYNERFLVDVLGVGVAVGSMVNSTREEERTVVAAERVAAAVEEVMGDGEEAGERRRKAREMKEAAEKAVGEGGSSEVDLGRMVDELLALKRSRTNEKAM